MIERDGEVSVKRQAQLLALSRSSVYYVARDLPARDLKLMRILDELHLKWPFYGARKLTRELQNQGHEVGRRHVTTLMRRMGMEAIYRKPRTSIPAPLAAQDLSLPAHGPEIERPNQVWAADITYLPMAHGFRIWWRSSTVAVARSVLAGVQHDDAGLLRRGAAGGTGQYGKPEIFNTDQGSPIHLRGVD